MMDPEHKKKIDEAIKIVEEGYQCLFKAAEGVLPKEEFLKFKDFILQNTVTMGGMFRSVFTNTPINDIDIYFTSGDAVDEFRHMVHIGPYASIFPRDLISKNSVYGFKPEKGYTLNFTTQLYGEPDEVSQTFDFSWNQHWFQLYNFHMRFDIDTFLKKGSVTAIHAEPLRTYFRMVRFVDEGFQLGSRDLMCIAQALVNRSASSIAAYQFLEGNSYLIRELGSSYGPSNKDKKVELSGMAYSDYDYFNMTPTPEVAQMYVKTLEWQSINTVHFSNGTVTTPSTGTTTINATSPSLNLNQQFYLTVLGNQSASDQLVYDTLMALTDEEYEEVMESNLWTDALEQRQDDVINNIRNRQNQTQLTTPY